MGIIDQVSQAFGGTTGGSGSGQSALLQAALHMLSQSGSGDGNGLAGLVQAFEAKGLGNIISSWIGTGHNLPISVEQILHTLGNERVQQLAAKAGVSPEVASTQLANLLPGLVDTLTPDGKIPQGGMLEQGLNLFKGKLAGA